ncbi:MAG: helix-turn-helix transcriptional regulator [Planctomycetota bacterium]|jgi:ATP/maltotriose-dependent transcriptional regulator MalT
MVITAYAELGSEQEWSLLKENLGLSGCEAEIVRRILHAGSDRQVAQDLNVSVPTVRTHMINLLQKFDVNDRAELLAYVSMSLWACQNDL